MGAPTGNQFWKLRSKHGRDKLFGTPDLMWEAACEYFEWCDTHPLEEEDYRGKDADRVILHKMRPFTLHGLCRYLDCNTEYFNHFYKDLKGKEDETSNDFRRVITRIKETVYDQKFTGAAAGFLNANLISRDLGLAEKQEARQVDKDGNDIGSGPTQIVIVQGTATDGDLDIKEAEE